MKKIKGISVKKIKSGIRYVSKTYLNGRLKYLGTFKTLNEAIESQKPYLKIKIIKNWRKTREYRIWRVRCIRRDKKCFICCSRKHLQVHHIKNGNHHPKYRFEVNNGVTLCRNCHTNFHTNFKKSFRVKCNEDDWQNFCTLYNYFDKITNKEL